MKVKLDVTDNAEVEVVTDDDGTITEIVITPRLLRKDGVGLLAKVTTTTNKGRVVDNCLITVSGSNGKVSRSSDKGTNLAKIDEDEGDEPEDEDEPEGNGK